jgi:transposase-like protein
VGWKRKEAKNMSKTSKVPKEIKEEILKSIKEEGLEVKDAAKQYGIHHKTIYGWLSGNISQMSALEANRLKRDNQLLTTIIGKLNIALSKQKKGALAGLWLHT